MPFLSENMHYAWWPIVVVGFYKVWGMEIQWRKVQQSPKIQSSKIKIPTKFVNALWPVDR